MERAAGLGAERHERCAARQAGSPPPTLDLAVAESATSVPPGASDRGVIHTKTDVALSTETCRSFKFLLAMLSSRRVAQILKRLDLHRE